MTLTFEKIRAALYPQPKQIRRLASPPFRLKGKKYLLVSNTQLVRALDLTKCKAEIHIRPDLPPYALQIANRTDGPFQELVPYSKSPEAFGIRVDASGIHACAAGVAGLRYARDVLMGWMAEDGKRIPALEISDGPSLEIRGVMIDVARQVESMDYLHGLVDRLAECRVNMLMLYFEDKLAFQKHPKLRHPMAYTLADMRGLARHASGQGMDLVPCLATLGHCSDFLKVPEYRHLSDGGRIYQLNPLHPGTRRLLCDMFDDWATVNPGGWIHTACDEAPYMGHSANTRAYVRRHGRDGLFAYHVQWMNDELKRRGYRMMIWADMMRHYPRILDLIDKDILLVEWNYGKIGEKDRAALRLFRSKGFEYLVAPAASRSAQLFFPAYGQVNGNIPDFAQLGLAEGARGILNTQWECFTRFSPASEPGLRLGSTLAWEGSGFQSREKRNEAYRRVFGMDGKRVDRIYSLARAENLTQRSSRIHGNPAVKTKTYHLHTHETFPTDPLVYQRYGASAWARAIERRYAEALAEALESFPSSKPYDRIMRFSAQNALLLAWKRTKINDSGRWIRRALQEYKRGANALAAKSLAAAIKPVREARKLAGEVYGEALPAWKLTRKPDDPEFARMYGDRLKAMVNGFKRFEQVLIRSQESIRRGGPALVDRYLADRRVLVFRLKLMSKEEVNILRMNVYVTCDGKERYDRLIGAFQIPGTEYLYLWMPTGRMPDKVRLKVIRTQTVWTPREAGLEVYRLRTPLEKKRHLPGSIDTEDFGLVPADDIGYRCVRATNSEGEFERR